MSLFHTQQGSGRARCGIASIEFAVIVPAMLTLMLGTFEFINAWRVQQKLNTAAGQLVEMIAAQSKVTEGSAEGPGGSLGDFCTAASYNMYPYPMNTLSGWVESTTEQSTGSNGHPQDWANDTSCPASIRSGSFAETIALTGIANQPRSMFTQDGTTGGTTEKGYSAISVQLTYVYNNVLPFLLGKSRTFTAVATARPRSNTIIPCTYTSGSTTSPCPGVY